MADQTLVRLATRALSHGDFGDLARTVQRLKSVVREELDCAGVALSPVAAEAVDQILLKIGRIIVGDQTFRDHWDDIAGYATLVAQQLRTA